MHGRYLTFVSRTTPPFVLDIQNFKAWRSPTLIQSTNIIEMNVDAPPISFNPRGELHERSSILVEGTVNNNCVHYKKRATATPIVIVFHLG